MAMGGYQLGGAYDEFANDQGGGDAGSSGDYGFDPLNGEDPEAATPDAFMARFAMLAPGEQNAVLQALNPAVAGIFLKLLGMSFLPAFDQIMGGAGSGQNGPGAIGQPPGGMPMPGGPGPAMGGAPPPPQLAGLRGIQAGPVSMPPGPMPPSGAGPGPRGFPPYDPNQEG